jgi:hypothetical protein
MPGAITPHGEAGWRGDIYLSRPSVEVGSLCQLLEEGKEKKRTEQNAQTNRQLIATFNCQRDIFVETRPARRLGLLFLLVGQLS